MELWTGSMEIESILMQRENLAILCSNLTGNIWNGQIFVCSYSGVMENKGTLFVNSGVRKGLWHAGKLYIGTDEGILAVYSHDLQLLASRQTHNDSITGISKKGKKIVAADRFQALVLNEELSLVCDLQETGVKSTLWKDENTCLLLKTDTVVSVDVNTKEKHVLCCLPENCESFIVDEENIYVAGEGSLFGVRIDGSELKEMVVDGIVSCLEKGKGMILVGTETGAVVKVDKETWAVERIQVHNDKVTAIAVGKETFLTASLDKTIKVHNFS